MWFVIGCLLFLTVSFDGKAEPDSVGPYTVDRISPKYPPEAQKNHIEGYVLVEILVNKNGSVGSLKVIESEPTGVFDSAVFESVSQWKFTPVCGAEFSEAFSMRAPFEFAYQSNTESAHVINVLPPVMPVSSVPIVSQSDNGIRVRKTEQNQDCNKVR